MSITSISPIDGRYARVTQPLEGVLSEFALMKYRVRVELEWLRFLCAAQLEGIRALTPDEDAQLSSLIEHFSVADAERIKEIERTTRHDVKAVEYFIRAHFQLSSLADVGEFVHFACTSEDINNLAYALMLRDAIQGHWLPLAERVVSSVRDLAVLHRALPMMARTHGQPASPTTLGKELAVFAHRWNRQLEGIERLEYLGKFAGAVSNFNAHTSAYPDADWRALARGFVTGLGLTYNPLTTQIESHDFIAEAFHALHRFNQISLGFAQDVWQYISLGYFKQRVVAGEIGSSTMPHKVNPIDFENAEANFGVANATLLHLAGKLQVSRLQRDLSDSSALRNIGVGIAHGVIALNSLSVGIAKLEVNPERIHADLVGEWALLAEPIQTVMRKHSLSGGYERMKDLTRGERVTQTTLRQFIQSLEIPEPDKTRLLEMRPQDYTGLAAQLVDELLEGSA
jgi:adenylosuccinate lyase